MSCKHPRSFNNFIAIRRRSRQCASRDSTNQNASFVERFSPLERAVLRGICGEIFALFQACVGNFDTIPPWKVVGTLYLDSRGVRFKYFAFLSVCDKFELLFPCAKITLQMTHSGWSNLVTHTACQNAFACLACRK